MEKIPKSQLGKAGRHCAVKGCSHGDHRLRRWKNQMCPDHNCLFGNEEKCCCEPPFTLFNFPTRMKKPLDRQKWIQLINRSSSSGVKLWSPRKCSRVCSVHFVDGRSTEENPYPTENLGYDVKRKVDHITSSSSHNLLPSRRRKATKVHAIANSSTPTKPAQLEGAMADVVDVNHDHSYISIVCSDDVSINNDNLNLDISGTENNVVVNSKEEPYLFILLKLLLLLLTFLYTGQITSMIVVTKKAIERNLNFIKNLCDMVKILNAQVQSLLDENKKKLDR